MFGIRRKRSDQIESMARQDGYGIWDKKARPGQILYKKAQSSQLSGDWNASPHPSPRERAARLESEVSNDSFDQV